MAKPEPRRTQYEQWVRAFAPELYRFAYRLSGNHQIAEDLVQETFVEAWRSLAKQRQPDKARAWFFQILRYRYAHFIRDRRHDLQAAPLMETHDPPQPGQPLSEVLGQREALQQALDVLTPEIRETFLLVFMEGFKCREVAQELHLPLGTVLSRLSRARAVLRKSLDEQGMGSLGAGAGGRLSRLAEAGD
jgi:RNA polymerase sigma-70 factor, ECF subfamily